MLYNCDWDNALTDFDIEEYYKELDELAASMNRMVTND